MSRAVITFEPAPSRSARRAISRAISQRNAGFLASGVFLRREGLDRVLVIVDDAEHPSAVEVAHAEAATLVEAARLTGTYTVAPHSRGATRRLTCRTEE